MKMMLVPLDGGRPFPIEKAIVFFGRSTDCDITLTSSRKVSRKHCCIAQIDEHFLIRDLGSMNGVRVNDELIKEEGRIKSGDEIWVGDVGFRFEPFDAAALKRPPQQAGAAGSRSEKKQPPAPEPIDAAMLSQDIPVAVPDDELDEPRPPAASPRASGKPGKRTPLDEDVLAADSDEVIEISEDDIVED